jgi:hypothetical protein
MQSSNMIFWGEYDVLCDISKPGKLEKYALPRWESNLYKIKISIFQKYWYSIFRISKMLKVVTKQLNLRLFDNYCSHQWSLDNVCMAAIVNNRTVKPLGL